MKQIIHLLRVNLLLESENAKTFYKNLVIQEFNLQKLRQPRKLRQFSCYQDDAINEVQLYWH